MLNCHPYFPMSGVLMLGGGAVRQITPPLLLLRRNAKMRAEVTVGITGMSVLLQDPTYAGFAPDAQFAALLSFTSIGCLAALTFWSERWRRARKTRPQVDASECYPLGEEEETAVHSSAI